MKILCTKFPDGKIVAFPQFNDESYLLIDLENLCSSCSFSHVDGLLVFLQDFPFDEIHFFER